MDFTIITPNRNHAHFLRDCCESLAAQTEMTFKDWIIDPRG